jgi:hypothetical protein
MQVDVREAVRDFMKLGIAITTNPMTITMGNISNTFNLGIAFTPKS